MTATETADNQPAPLSPEVLFQQQHAKIVELAQMGKWKDLTPLNFPVVHQANRDLLPYAREQAFDTRLGQINIEIQQLHASAPELPISGMVNLLTGKQYLVNEMQEIFAARYPIEKDEPLGQNQLEFQVQAVFARVELLKKMKLSWEEAQTALNSNEDGVNFIRVKGEHEPDFEEYIKLELKRAFQELTTLGEKLLAVSKHQDPSI